VDRAMSAYLRYPGGATAWFDVSFTQGGKLRADVHVVGERGQPSSTASRSRRRPSTRSSPCG
jgi:hypothetical protein